MNPNTGQIYRGESAIQQAQERGEPLLPISEEAADRIESGYQAMNREERRRADRAARDRQRLKTGV